MVNLEQQAKKIRNIILDASFRAGACHIGSALSCVEILLAIDYVKEDNVLLFSKASGVSALYALLSEKGRIKEDVARVLKAYPLASKEVPGIIHSVGSLGHGLNVAVGMAYADRKKKVYCLISDGELNEGSTWEALLFAGHHKLSNLIVVIDYNKVQACGKTEDVLSLEPLASKLHAFNFEVRSANGHSINDLIDKLDNSSYGFPVVLIADTIKGKGVSFMENKVEWHYKNLEKPCVI